MNNPKKWFDNQLPVTISYYVDSTTNDLLSLNKIMDWVK